MVAVSPCAVALRFCSRAAPGAAMTRPVIFPRCSSKLRESLRRGTPPAKKYSMIQMHSRPKEQREAIRNLVNLVLTRDMGTFTPERFKDWIKETDARFRKVGLMLLFEIRIRTVHFTIKEIRTSRVAFRFASSSHVQFEDRDVVMNVEDFAKKAL